MLLSYPTLRRVINQTPKHYKYHYNMKLYNLKLTEIATSSLIISLIISSNQTRKKENNKLTTLDCKNRRKDDPQSSKYLKSSMWSVQYLVCSSPPWSIIKINKIENEYENMAKLRGDGSLIALLLYLKKDESVQGARGEREVVAKRLQ